MRIDAGPRQGAICQSRQTLCNDLLGTIEAAQENAGRLADGVRNNRSVGKLEVQGSLDEFLLNPQELNDRWQKLVGG